MRNPPRPVNAADAAALTQWKTDARAVLKDLREAGVDANAGQRVYSREELKRRMARYHKRLDAMLEALHLPGQQPAGDPLANGAENATPSGAAPEGVRASDAA